MCFGGGGSSAPYPYQPTTQEQAESRYRADEARFKQIRADQAAAKGGATVTIEDKQDVPDRLGRGSVVT